MQEEEILASFWTHLEELRITLLRAAYVVFGAVIIVLCFHIEITELIKGSVAYNEPSRDLIKKIFRTERVINEGIEPKIFQMPQEATDLLFSSAEDIKEVANRIYEIHPKGFITYHRPLPETALVALSPLEGFSTTLKICFWIALAISSPLWMALLLRFIFPGLKREEKRWLLLFFAFSMLSLFLGFLFAYKITIPLANRYFALFNLDIAANLWSLALYVDYLALIIAGHMIALELCFILLLLVHLRIISPEWLVEQRRIMIVAAFILGAILTPPDVVTQFAMAIPLIGVYELAILYAKIRAVRAVQNRDLETHLTQI